MSTYTPSPLTVGVTAEVAEQMVRSDVTVPELAERLDMGVKALENRLEGRAPWDIDQVHRVAQALGVEVLDLVPSA